MKKISAVILAAGKGTRMDSDIPKVLHKICGKPLLFYVLKAVRELNITMPYVIVGYKSQKVIDAFKDSDICFVHQKEQLGTGHAVMQVEPMFIGKDEIIIVLNGDMPLITADILKCLVEHHKKKKASATVLTAIIPDPEGYGRIVRNRHHDVDRIVEQKDGSLGELEINEINTGTYCFESRDLFPALNEIRPENAQHEYYLTDIIHILKKKRRKVCAVCAEDPRSAIGINTKEHLQAAEKALKRLMV